jgi:tight adherence protein C
MNGAIRFFGNMSPAKGAERTRLNLAQAGNPNNMQVTEYMGVRVVVAIGLAVLTALLSLFVFRVDLINVLLFSVAGLGLGYMAPVYWLGSKMKKRKKAILRSLPDAIDLLTICVEAGLAFDGAVQRLVDKEDNDIAREFRRFLNETRVGKPRRDALREMSARTGVPDVSQFIASIIQADQLGVSMSKVLRIQSDQMRIKRRQRAEEQAHRAPIIMIFPMVFLIFPAMYVVILGPSVHRFLAAFS